MSEIRSAEELWTAAHASVAAGDLVGGIRQLAQCYDLLEGGHDPRLAQVHARWAELYAIYTTLLAQRVATPLAGAAGVGFEAAGQEGRREIDDALAAAVFGEDVLANGNDVGDVFDEEVLDADAHGLEDVEDAVLDGEVLDGDGLEADAHGLQGVEDAVLEGDVLGIETLHEEGLSAAFVRQDLDLATDVADEDLGGDLPPAGETSASAGSSSDADITAAPVTFSEPEPIRVEARSALEEATSLAEQAESLVNEGELAAGVALYERLVVENPGNELAAERLAELRAAAARDETLAKVASSWGATSPSEESVAVSSGAGGPASAHDDVAFLEELLQRVEARRRAG
ncbi:MAG: hypothetical protein ACO3JL_03570 [Myxococcota bacterium]